MNEGLVIIIILAALIIYVIYRRKKAAKLKAEGKTPFGKTYLGCSLPLIIFIIIVFIGMWFYVPFLQESYKKAEIDAEIRLFEPKYLEISEKYMTFTDKESRELAAKLYLLNRCEGSEETIKKLDAMDSIVLSGACSDILHLKHNEIILNSRSELENLKNLNKIDFGNAFKYFQFFIEGKDK